MFTNDSRQQAWHVASVTYSKIQTRYGHMDDKRTAARLAEPAWVGRLLEMAEQEGLIKTNEERPRQKGT